MVYEFSNKEIRSKFKQTEYGIKTNKWLYISLSVGIFFVVLELVFYFLGKNEVLTLDKELMDCLHVLTAITLVLMCYFDGKRDGAIEQFKKNNKNGGKK